MKAVVGRLALDNEVARTNIVSWFALEVLVTWENLSNWGYRTLNGRQVYY